MSARSPDTVRQSLSRIGLQVCLRMVNGSTYFADVVFPPRPDGTVAVWFWGCTRTSDLRVEDIAFVSAADVTEHKTFAAIRMRQKAELEGGNR